MDSYLWWGKHILIACTALFFLVFGLETLIGSYHLKNPMEFIMHFFSSSLMVLISLVGLLYPALRIRAHLKNRKHS